MFTETKSVKQPPQNSKAEPEAKAVQKGDKKTEQPKFDKVDQASKDSFPASDPPGWWS